MAIDLFRVPLADDSIVERLQEYCDQKGGLWDLQKRIEVDDDLMEAVYLLVHRTSKGPLDSYLATRGIDGAISMYKMDKFLFV